MLVKIVRLLGGTFFVGFSLNMFGLDFLTFSSHDDENNLIYHKEDARVKQWLFPFPCIFHYNDGGDTSSRPFFRIVKELSEADIPDSLKTFLTDQVINPDQIQYFEACCIPLHATMNYFTHPWAMDRMVENRIVSVASGMFESENLSPINGEMGVNAVVAQAMNFHDAICLSGNVARFKMDNFSKPAKAWFVSVYDPAVNAGKNAECNQVKRAIVVYWHFVPEMPDGQEPWFIETSSGELADILHITDVGEPSETLRPLFIPQK